MALPQGFLLLQKKNNNSVIYYLSGVLITLFFLLVFSNGQPFGPEFSILKWYTIFSVLCVSTLIFLSVYLNVGSINAGFVEKYFLEAFYSRLMWGLGLLFFILIVIIPFYVMVMTSLKNQQSLLRNPLDFSIDFSLGPEKIFNSYIELFLKYDFLTLLINSAFVSIVTVSKKWSDKI